ncbi:MAG: GAF domain-containing protein [Chloroflexia bacterium]|nr:GAF domain-containing protein [Chloroflexia bacterium]
MASRVELHERETIQESINGDEARGDVYTMAEAARLKGVSYHTVSRAVRGGKLPARRLGRMALIDAEQLRTWRPMRERAPLKYRRREPMPDATPALLDLASGERVALARQLSTLYEVIHGAATELPLASFLELLSDRLSAALGFKRVAIWGVDLDRRIATRLATFGPLFSDLPDEMPLDEMRVLKRVLELPEARVFENLAPFDVLELVERHKVTSLFGAPLRVGGRVLGAVFGDCVGEPFHLTPDQLSLAQVLANQAALALEQARLRAAELSRADQLAAVLEDLSEAVCACDAAGQMTLANAAGRAMVGLGELPLAPGLDALDVLSLIDRFEFSGEPIAVDELPLFLALRGERVQGREYLLRRSSDGVEIAVRVNARPIGTDERIQGAVAVARDITGERLAARREGERLAQHESAAKRARAIADVALAVNAHSDVNPVLQTVIDQMTELLGGSSGALFLRADDGQLVSQAKYQPVSSPETERTIEPVFPPARVASFTQREPFFYRYDDAAAPERTSFNRSGVQAALIVPLLVANEVIGFACVNYSDAEHKPTEEDLSFAAALAGQCAVAIDKARLQERSDAAHRRLLAVVDQLPQGVIIAEAPEGEIVLANRAAERLWHGTLTDAGMTASELPITDAMGEPFEAGANPLERTLLGAAPRFGESLRVKRGDGSYVRVAANHAPIIDGAGRVLGAVSMVQDAAQLSNLDQAKDEFLSVVAHELRNPLTSLRGNLQLLERRLRKSIDPRRGEEIERFDAILAQTDRMGDLVNRLLDVSRADLDKFDLTFASIDAVALARGAVESARGVAKGRSIEVEAPKGLAVVWDQVRIEQVLTNLLSNAIKYAPEGLIALKIESISNQVRIQVRDHGPGVGDAFKTRLFERYYRAPRESAVGNLTELGGTEGLGLGLYISRKIVDGHGGHLRVTDAEGGGALFTLKLPRDASAHQPISPVIARPPVP